jgi:hypothetical protein
MLMVFSLVMMFVAVSSVSWGAVEYLGRNYADSTSDNTTITFTANVPADTTFAVGVAHSSRSKSPEWMALHNQLMTKVDGLCHTEGGRRLAVFILPNPPTGDGLGVGVQYESGDKRGKIAAIMYYKGVDLSDPLGAMIKESSNDPFTQAGNFLALADLPRGCEVLTAITGGVISALNGKHFGDANINNFDAGGGTAKEIYNARPRRSTGVDYLGIGTSYRVYGTFTGNVRPEWNNYTGDGSAVAVVIKPAPMTVTYVSNPSHGGTTNGPNKIAEYTGSVNFTANPAAGYILGGTPTATSGSVTPDGPSFRLTNVATHTTVTANFLEVGYLKVNLTGPAEAAKWSIDNGATWNNSGATVTTLVGNKTITFKPVTGLTAPDSQSVTIAHNSSETRTGVYMATVTYLAEDEGSIEGEAIQTLPYGTATSSVTAVPKAGYLFDQWDDGVKTASRSDNSVTHTTVTASFKNTPPVINVSPDQVFVECPGTYTLDDARIGVSVSDAEETLYIENIEITEETGAVFPFTDLRSYTLRYNISDSHGLAAEEKTRTVILQDTLPPVLTVFVAENTVMTYQGEPYDCPIAEAWDNCDGELTVNREGDVDTDTLGIYELKYTVTDNVGLSASRKITVQVVRPGDPSIMKVEVEGPFSVLVTWNRDVTGIDAALDAANYTVSGSGVGSLNAQPVAVGQVSDEVVRLVWADDAGEMLNGGDIIITVPEDFEDNLGYGIGARQGEDTEGAIGLAPEITLAGGDMTLECNVDVYEEPGATAEDNIDGVMEPHLSGYVNTSLPGEYVVAYTAKDAVGNENIMLRRVDVEDTEAPLLELLGAANMEVECGTAFVDPEVTAYDQCAGDLINDVEVSGDVVNTNAIGQSFTITYDVKDSEGNAAPTVSRTVTIVDNTGPELALLGTNPMVLDGITIYDEPGAVAIDACGNVNCTDDIQITGNVNVWVEGDYEVTYTVADARGNESKAVREVIVRRKYCDLLYDLEVDPNPALPGETVTMRAVELPGSCPIGVVHYQWEKRIDGKADDFLPIPGADDLSQFVLQQADEGDSGQYRCTVTDSMISRHTPIVALTVDTGIPAAGGLGIALTAVAALVAGALVLRRKAD